MKALLFVLCFLVSPNPESAIQQAELFAYGKFFCVQMTINARPCMVIVDTGSEFSMIAADEVSGLGLKRWQRLKVQLTDLGGNHASLYSMKPFDIRIAGGKIPSAEWYTTEIQRALPKKGSIQPVGILGTRTLKTLNAKITFGPSPTLTYTLP